MPGRIAAQLYTVREYTKNANDFENSLGLIHEIGYDGVQLSAVECMSGDDPEVDAATARQMLDANGLVCAGTHTSFEALRDHTDAEIERLRILGCNFVAIGGIWPDDYSAFATFIEESGSIIDTLKVHGIRFGYHNHAHEFVRRPDGIAREPAGGTYYELLIDGNPDLMLEIDTYWALHAGVDPAKLLRRCAGRVPLIHVKDKEVVPKEGPTYAPVGEGNLDWNAILSAGEAAGVEWYTVEQDSCRRDPFDCLRSSWNFLSARL
jgi:sugar phosphate isomerase/epimerase